MTHYSVFLSFQEFGLARFKTSVTKTMKGFEYVLAKMQGKPSITTMSLICIALIAGTKASFILLVMPVLLLFTVSIHINISSVDALKLHQQARLWCYYSNHSSKAQCI